jgi:tetratricopeptide (TPR) repeat protein
MGNKLGWILAIVLVTAVVGVIVYFLVFPSPSGPKDTRRAGMLDRQEIATDVASVVGFDPGDLGNAADDYAEAAAIALRERNGAVSDVNIALLDAKKGEPAEADAQAVNILREIAEHVADGARKAECKYLFVHTPKALEVHVEVAGVNRLGEVTAAVRILAQYYASNKQYDEAAEVLKDLLVMGRHLIDERTHLHIVRAGMGATNVALPVLDEVYRAQGAMDAERQAVAKYRAAFLEFERYFDVKYQIVWTARAGGPEPGDIFNIVENDKDPAWRVQAILAMGIVKFATRQAKDKKYALKLLDELVGDQDEIIAMAAQAAKKQTLEDHRGLGSKMLQPLAP